MEQCVLVQGHPDRGTRKQETKQKTIQNIFIYIYKKKRKIDLLAFVKRIQYLVFHFVVVSPFRHIDVVFVPA